MNFVTLKFRTTWRRVVHPKYETFHMMAIYGLATLTGILGTFYPPETVQSVLGPQWMTATTVLLAFGGALGLIGAPFGDRWAERPGVLFIVGASVLYIVTIFENLLFTESNRFLQLGTMLMLFLFLSKRFWKIRNGRVDPLSVR